MALERLQKGLARAGVASRRKAEELIRQGRVTINGRPARLGDRADLATDSVKVDGRRVQASLRPARYVLLNKPQGYVSTCDDPQRRPTVMDLLPAGLRRGLAPVGRLDFDTEGLLLLTDDGEIANRVTHPRYGCRKTYRVKVKGHPEAGSLEKLRQGIRLYGKLTAPAKVGPASVEGPRAPQRNSWWTVVLREGRTRQLREMFFRLGHPVQRLRRTSIGPLNDRGLKRGHWRELTPKEVAALRKATGGGGTGG